MDMRMQPRAWERCEDRQDQGPSEKDRCELCRRDGMEDSDRHWEGILPCAGPLANPYVPFQRNNPPTYPARKGVVRGTLFPGLDLPYRGMVNEGTLSQTHLHELQSLSFAITELGEYLDTHSDDKEAFELFRSYVELYRQGQKKYEALHGPLMQKSAAEAECYNWLKDPWPWDYEANHKGE